MDCIVQYFYLSEINKLSVITILIIQILFCVD